MKKMDDNTSKQEEDGAEKKISVPPTLHNDDWKVGSSVWPGGWGG